MSPTRSTLSSARNCFQTGLFRQVKLKDSLREDGLSDIHLLAVEKQPGVWSNRVFWEPLYLGGGVETQVRYRNFGGRFHEGNVGALVFRNRPAIVVGIRPPIPFGRIFRFEDKFSYNQEELPILNYPDSLEQRFEFKNRATVSHYFTPNIRGVFSADVRRITLYAGQNALPIHLNALPLTNSIWVLSSTSNTPMTGLNQHEDGEGEPR